MAKKTAQGSSRNTASSSRRNVSSRRNKNINLLTTPINDRRVTYKSFFRRIGSSPLAYYLGGGVASLLIARFSYRYYQEHPEIKDFLRENFDNVEDKLREYRDSFMSDETEARH